MGAIQEFYNDFKNLIGIKDKSFADLQPEVPPYYSQLNDGTHSYNYETTRHGLFSFFGFGDDYFSPKENLKWYYENVGFFGDCINIYADIASQVRIKEIDKNGNVVENSDFCKLLDQPNNWQDGIAFIKEVVINSLCDGVNVMYGNFFRNGNLRTNPSLYNIDFFNLKFPKIKNPYEMKRRDIEDLVFFEKLEGNSQRKLFHYELAFIYDTISRKTYGEKGYNSDKFLNPISRVFGIRKDLQTLINSADNMAFLSEKKVNFIISKKNNNGQLAPLGTAEKMDIENKLGGWRMQRVGKSDVIATNEDLQTLPTLRDVKKMQLTEMQNNAKENIRSRFGIPRDLLDAYTGTNSGSTYENQQFAEARFTLNNVKNITDSWLYSLEKKNPQYFANGNKLVGSYEHMPSVVAINTKLKNDGFKAKAEALIKFFEAFEKSKSLGIEINYNDFLRENGFEEFLKSQKAE